MRPTKAAYGKVNFFIETRQRHVPSYFIIYHDVSFISLFLLWSLPLIYTFASFSCVAPKFLMIFITVPNEVKQSLPLTQLISRLVRSTTQALVRARNLLLYLFMSHPLNLNKPLVFHKRFKTFAFFKPIIVPTLIIRAAQPIQPHALCDLRWWFAKPVSLSHWKIKFFLLHPTVCLSI